MWRTPLDIPDSFVVFHGTSDIYQSSFEQKGILPPPKMKKVRDFGSGFYTTTEEKQARRYAARMAELLGGRPLLVTCTVSGTRLKEISPAKILPDYNREWLDILKQGRWSGEPLEFQWIFGRCGDGLTERVEEVRRTGDDEALLATITPKRGTRTYEHDQFWFGTAEAGTMSITVGSLRTVRIPATSSGDSDRDCESHSSRV
ncbi:DUF3990 domain-containing protein [Sulfobacillus sp. DSM 109850]|uniref:DUF3990 domain-containing protein n=1 Tax=Sulfobacillus harzensis TaxID=2729629 RepID=A0A7Y0Q300_9FIRM|nr:DUF3990 domain-containing protein [Sulfobacillus harzensis]